MDDLVMPWPRKGDRLFSCGADWWHNACLGWCSRPGWIIRDGYKQGAQVLVRQAMEDTGQLDALIYPVAFLYRHYIELTLKDIIEQGCALLKGQCADLRGHRLRFLWNEARPLLIQVFPEGKVQDLEAVEECIYELDNVDSTSQVFRYAETTKGERPLEAVRHINIRNFSEVIERTVTFLDCCDTATCQYLQDCRDHEC